jgi:hypothetical protein
MAKIMESNIGQFCFGKDFLEFDKQSPRIYRCAYPGRKDKARFLPFVSSEQTLLLLPFLVST